MKKKITQHFFRCYVIKSFFSFVKNGVRFVKHGCRHRRQRCHRATVLALCSAAVTGAARRKTSDTVFWASDFREKF